MAFPQVVGEGSTDGTDNTTSRNVAIGSPDEGDLVVLWVASDGNTTISLPGGWTEVAQLNPNGVTVALFYKVAEGNEGATVAVGTTDNEWTATKYFRITGFDPDTPLEATMDQINGSGDLSLTPTGGAKDYLWIVLDGRDGNPEKTYTGFPTNYTNTGSLISSNISAGVAIAWARRELNTTTQPGGGFTVGNDAWVGGLVAIYPAAASANNIPVTTYSNRSNSGFSRRS